MEYAEAWFESAFVDRPNELAVDDGLVALTGSELAERARSVAAALAADSPRIVGLELASSTDWVVAMHASWLTGAAVLPIDSRADAGTVEQRRERCDVVIDRLPEGDSSFEARSINPMAPAVILYTSGTSAEPLEVMLSHANLIAQGTSSMHPLGGSPRDRWLSSLSPTHTGGLTVPVRCSVWGATAVIRERFDVESFLEILSDGNQAISIVSLVPLMLARLLDAGLCDPPVLRRAVISGAPFSPSLKARALASGVPAVEAWGMTQTCGMAAVEREPGDGGAGSALPGIHIETAEDGEIRIGGPTVSPGVQVGGMFDSGDLGRIIDGSLHVVGRKSSMIISGGENVSPERVEHVLESHPAVMQALVSGESDAEWGEVVVSTLVLAAPVDDSELIEHCRGLLSPWEVPKRFNRVAELDLTDSGKPKRRRPSND